MQALKSSIAAFLITSLAISILTASAAPQSGRGRPKVVQPEAPEKREPIKIPANTAVVKQEQAGTTSRFVLQNGITVILSEQHAVPIVAAVAYFKAPASSAGTARARSALAESLFRGTTQRPGDKARRDLRKLGALTDFAADNDGTVFTLIAAPEKAKDVLAVQADVIQNPLLNEDAMLRAPSIPTDIAPGADNGFEQDLSSSWTLDSIGNSASKTSHSDSPARFASTRLSALVRRTPIAETSAAITRAQLQELYRANCRPENLVVSIAGDISAFDMLITVQQLFGSFGLPAEAAAPVEKTRAAAKPAPSTSRLPAASGTAQAAKLEPKPAAIQNPEQAPTPDRFQYQTERADISESIVSLGFRVPGSDSKEEAALEIIAALTGIGRASRFNRSLVETSLAANRVESRYRASAKEGVFEIQMCLAPDQNVSLDKAESGLFKELSRLRTQLVGEGELARARTLLEKRHNDAVSNYLGRAYGLARGEAVGGGFKTFLDYVSRINSVRAEDLQQVASRYFTLSNTTVYEYEPRSAAPRTFNDETFAATVKAWAPNFDATVDASSVRPPDKSAGAPIPQNSERSAAQRLALESLQPLPVKDFSTLNGPKAFVSEDHSKPVVTMAILFQGGQLTEDTTTSGTTELMLRSILYGTPRRTSVQLTDELEGIGAEVKIVIEPDFFGFVLSSLSRNGERALKLLRDAIEEPAFREEDIANAKLDQIAAIRLAHDSGTTRARELLLQSLYPGHPYSLPAHGREEVITKLTSEKLAEWYSRTIKRELPIAFIVGDTSGSALVSSQLAEGFRRRDPETSIQVRTPRSEPSREKAESRSGEGSLVAIGFPGPKAESADRAAMNLIAWSLRGEGGRLQRAMPKGILVSDIDVELTTMFAAGNIAALLRSSSENEQKARSAVLAAVDEIAKNGLSPDDLASAVELAKTYQLAAFQSQVHRALDYARAFLYLKSAAEAEAFSEQLAKVSAEEVKKAASTWLKPGTAVSAIVRGTSTAVTPTPPQKQN